MRDMLIGDHVIRGHFDGMLSGTATVPAGAEATVAGMINGTLIVEQGADVRITGMVNGAVVDHGATITISGMVNGGRCAARKP